MTSTIEQLETAFARCRALEVTTFVSFYGDKIHVNLTKHAYNGNNKTAFDVKGEGATVVEAFEHAFANFPVNPLDGVSRWASSQLEAPIDAVFTEAP